MNIIPLDTGDEVAAATSYADYVLIFTKFGDIFKITTNYVLGVQEIEIQKL